MAVACAAMAGAASSKRNGVIHFSNQEKLEGAISLTPGKRLLLRTPKQRRPLEVSLSDVAQIDVKVTRRQVLKEWRFKEEGSPEKMYTGQTYPRLDFGLVVSFTDGKKLECTVVKGTPIRVDVDDGKRRRVVLQNYMTGKIGQLPDDLVYIQKIVLAAPENSPEQKDEPATMKEPTEAVAADAEEAPRANASPAESERK